jgi:hypothetical protein
MGKSTQFRAIVANAATKSSLIKMFQIFMLYLTGIAMAIAPASYWRDTPSLSIVRWKTFRYMIPPVVVVYLLVTMIFIFIPSPVGGLPPKQEIIWVTSGGLDILASCNKGAKDKLQAMRVQDKDDRPDFFQVDNLYLLHVGSTHTFLWSDECSSISKVSNELIKGTQWTDPNRKAVPATK